VVGKHLTIVVALILLCAVSRADAQEWTRFRGPNGTGLATARNLTVPQSEKDFAWRVALPGTGHSSPVLWGKRLFVTAADRKKQHLLCLNADTGKTLWTRSQDYREYSHHQFNTAASATPTVDRERVYTIWANPDAFTVVAYTHDGAEVWRKNLGVFPSQHGGAPCPIVQEGLLIFSREPDGQSGELYALDTKTGAIRWRRERPGQDAPYSVPMVYQPKGGTPQILFANTANGVTGVDVKTGKVLWETPGLLRLRCVGSLIESGGLIFITSGNGGGSRLAVALRPNGTSPPEIAYRLTRGTSYVPTPIAVGEWIFYWGDGGIVNCTKRETGETVWQERAGGRFFGSPIFADGKLWGMSTQGELVVIEATNRYKPVGRLNLGEPAYATPAVANGTVYLRTEGHLIAVRGKL